MDENANKFLEAEKTAEQLVKRLKELQSEAENYKHATGNLEEIKEKLIELINSTKKVINDDKKVIEILNEIGGEDLLNRLKNIEQNINNNKKIISDFKIENSNRLFKHQKFIILILIASILAVILSIIHFFI